MTACRTPGRGKGIACSWWLTTGGSSGVYVKLNPDGTVALTSGAVELGTGALDRRGANARRGAGVDLDRHQRIATVDTQHVALRLRRPG